MNEITSSDLFAYAVWRKEHIVRPEFCHHDFPGNSIVNRELATLRLILTAADLWDSVGRHYRPLPMPASSPGQALTPTEMARLFAIGESRPRWEVALCCVSISACTTAGPSEIRNLQLGDIKLDGVPSITIKRGAKNKFRLRELPLNNLALAAITKLLKRAAEKGCHLPTHYLLPHRAYKLSEIHDPHTAGGNFDPNRPQESYKKAWGQIRAAFAKEFPERAKFRLYDFRHTGITMLLSDADTPPQVVREIAGHCNEKMLTVYSHQRKELRLAALQRLGEAFHPTQAPAAPPSQAISTTTNFSGTLGFGLRGLEALRKVSS
ncbi:MAG TPA: tyrosine-type recombinase/integrase [Terriglobales bacterium]|nr:tyrosine-type recombinase/integrase [Terriglobales bacterium]